MPPSPTPQQAPQFWRDDALPYIEARSIADGRRVCYAKHTHATFSIGIINGGESTYLNGTTQTRIGAGATVVINPEEVHACNPIDDQPWSYRMFYVDAAWLASVQNGARTGSPDSDEAHDIGYRPYANTAVIEPGLTQGLNRLYAVLTDDAASLLEKESAAVACFTDVDNALAPADLRRRPTHPGVVRAADFIRAHCAQALKLDDICAAAGLSSSYLIRAFRARYGMTPHAYLIDRRVELSRALLKRGRAIAEVAAQVGFADQAHLQRAFRERVAATPGQYRR
jgi:AraC-like DNA-binding protein